MSTVPLRGLRRSADGSQRCDRSAARINSLLSTYHSRFGLRFTPPTLFNIVFTAGTTHLLAAVRHRSTKVKDEALNNTNECVSFLRLVAESWPAAGHKADILQELVEDYCRSNIQKNECTPGMLEKGQPAGVERPNVNISADTPSSQNPSAQPISILARGGTSNALPSDLGKAANVEGRPEGFDWSFLMQPDQAEFSFKSSRPDEAKTDMFSFSPPQQQAYPIDVVSSTAPLQQENQ